MLFKIHNFIHCFGWRGVISIFIKAHFAQDVNFKNNGYDIIRFGKSNGYYYGRFFDKERYY